MPINYQTAANLLKNRITPQYQGPAAATLPAPGGPNVATPEVVIPRPPDAQPPVAGVPPVGGVPTPGEGVNPVPPSPNPAPLPIQPGMPPDFGQAGIVPVNRDDIAAKLALAAGGAYPSQPSTVDGDAAAKLQQALAAGVVPVDRQEAVKQVLENPVTREAAAKVGGVVLGNEAQEQARQAALIEQARLIALKTATAPVAPVTAPVAEKLPVAPAPVAPPTYTSANREQVLQDYLSAKTLPYLDQGLLGGAGSYNPAVKVV